jgi:hypothetical protein
VTNVKIKNKRIINPIKTPTTIMLCGRVDGSKKTKTCSPSSEMLVLFIVVFVFIVEWLPLAFALSQLPENSPLL